MNTVRLSFLVLPLAALPLLAACGSNDADAAPGSADPSQDEVDAWNAAAEENAAGKADNAACSGVVVPDRGGFNKHIALTFDDGPNLETTPKVLDILAKHHAKGLFFINGKNVRSDAHYELLKQMRDAGHLLGNHSQNHLNLKTVDAATLKSEIEGTLYVLKKVDVQPGFFRFPFGAAGCTQTEKVRSYGYHVTGWHIDSADWCYAAAKGGVGYCHPDTFKYVPDQYRNDIVGFSVYQAKSTGGGVILFHDIHAYTVSKLDEILTALEQAGFSFVGADDTTTFPLLNGAAPASSPWVGTPCQSSSACAFTAAGAAGACYTYDGGGFCSLPCEGYCPDKSNAMRTFCVSLDGGASGQCVAKSGPENHDCADIPGTTPTTLDRFVGSSTASPSSASVCVP